MRENAGIESLFNFKVNKMNFTLKTAVIKTLRALFQCTSCLPVSPRKVLFSSYEGRQYNCNPKYIFERLIEEEPEMEYVWVLNDSSLLPEKYRDRVKVVRFLSSDHIKALLSSRVIVSNLGVEPFLPHRKGRMVINTWHGGGAYKRVSSDMAFLSEEQKRYMTQMRDMRAASTDVVFSSCNKFTEVSSRDFNIPASRFAPTGMPRNDRFFTKDTESRDKLRADIGRRYGIAPETLWVLYAPTFRGDHHSQQEIDNDVCCRKVAESLYRRFGKNVSFMFRSHNYEASMVSNEERGEMKISDFTDYPDMQELLDVADILVTDYSSSIWDYSLSGKPAFLYMPDLKVYMKERGFYTDLADWPYPHAENIDDFCALIEAHDSKIAMERIERHLKLLGSHEDGKATEKCVKIIKDALPTKK